MDERYGIHCYMDMQCCEDWLIVYPKQVTLYNIQPCRLMGPKVSMHSMHAFGPVLTGHLFVIVTVAISLPVQEVTTKIV